MSKQGVILVNLGSPDSTSVSDVRRYLGEFLMDGRVIDMPFALRALIVHGCILPFRPRASAEAYQKIWSDEGSPLVVHGRHLRNLLQRAVTVPIELAMRYGAPSIMGAVTNLHNAGIDEIICIPLFPHYAMSSYETAVERVREVIRQAAPGTTLRVMPPYFDRPDYIHALVANAADHLADGYDHLLFSFHGLPERHLRKTDPTHARCLESPDCCDAPSDVHQTCYRAQCFKTVKAFVSRAGVPQGKYSVAFQSRLGRDKWLAPSTAHELQRLAQSGVKKLVVMCPAFVADCLETQEELGMRGKAEFLAAGGSEFTLIPCLNHHPLWVAALANMVEEFGLTREHNHASFHVLS